MSLDEVMTRVAELERLVAPARPAPSGSGAAFATTLAQVGGAAAGWPTVAGWPTSAAGARAGREAATGPRALAAASRYLGVPYRWGGTDPASGLDCSGLVQRAFADVGVTLPRVAADQARTGAAVPDLASARPGDLVAFGSPAHHIGIYAGDGRMLVAPHTGGVVEYEAITERPSAIRRILPAADNLSGSQPSEALASVAGRLGLAWSGNGMFPAPASPANATSAYAALSIGGSTDPLAGLNGTDPLAGLNGTDPLAGLDGAGPATGGGGPAGPALAAAPGQYSTLFEAAAARYGLPADLLAAVAQTESGFNPSAVSPAGAQGLMQLMPATATSLGVNPMDPASAVDGAARILSGNLQRFGSVPLAVAAYNAGAGAVARFGGIPPYPETQHYVRAVLAGAGLETA